MVLRVSRSNSKAIAELHFMTLDRSFLAKMGIKFLTTLYSFIIQKEIVFAVVENGSVKGFVSFSKNSSKMMKKFLFSCPFCIIRIIGIIISEPTYIKRIAETFTAPFKSKKNATKAGKVDLPHAELLSISVNSNYQKSGIGKQLLDELEKHLKENNILKYKVIAGASLKGANKFYKKNGFILVTQVIIHGNELSNIYIKEL